MVLCYIQNYVITKPFELFELLAWNQSAWKKTCRKFVHKLKDQLRSILFKQFTLPSLQGLKQLYYYWNQAEIILYSHTTSVSMGRLILDPFQQPRCIILSILVILSSCIIVTNYKQSFAFRLYIKTFSMKSETFKIV